MVKCCRDQAARGHREFTSALDAAIPALSRETLVGCAFQWVPQWAMAAYCITQQVDAAAQIGTTLAEIPENVAAAISQQCQQTWGADYAMLGYCAKQQAEAWKALQE